MKIPDFQPFAGQHCETTTTGSLLQHLGIKLSEPMLFGLGEALSFIYWDMPKQMDFPFLGGRVRQDVLTRNLCRNLGLHLEVRETSSPATAWKTVKAQIDREIPVGLKLDCYYLDYFTEKIHFAAHYVALYGYDEAAAYVVDVVEQGGFEKVSLPNLALARNEKGPMSSPNLSYTITQRDPIPALSAVIPGAIRRNAVEFLNPPIRNLTWKGIQKTGQKVKAWLERSQEAAPFQLTARLMEEGGTGGALFRNLYRDFLKESLNFVPSAELEAGWQRYAQIAPLWNAVSGLIAQAGQTRAQACLDEASRLLAEIASREKEAMEILARVGAG